MYEYTKIEGGLTLKHGILSGEATITTITIEDSIYTETVTAIVCGNGWMSETTKTTSTIIPTTKSIYAIINELFMARTDAGCEEIPPVPAICATCPCKHLCDWLCTHDAI